MKRTMTTDEAIKRWNQHAEVFTAGYTEYGDRSREVFLNPAIFSLMEDVSNKKVLDAGCGEGYLSRILANNGAEVTAVDYAEKMIQLAKQKTINNTAISYHHGNCENLHFLPDEEFDRIISNMVLQDLENYEGALREMYRLLKQNGTFIFSILHPCFVTPYSGWVRNEQGVKTYWKVEQYFFEGVYDQKIPIDADEKVVYYHRTLTSYFKAIHQAGFSIEEIVEPMPSVEMLQKYPEFAEDLNFSCFLVFKLRK